MTEEPIYLDYNATTPLLPEVVDAMVPFLREHFGNSSSTHPVGRIAIGQSNADGAGSGAEIEDSRALRRPRQGEQVSRRRLEARGDDALVGFGKRVVGAPVVHSHAARRNRRARRNGRQ